MLLLTEKVSFFNEAIRFTPIWGFVDLLLIIHFVTSWSFSSKKTGWKIDFWYLTLFIGSVQHLLFLYPFNASSWNAYTLDTLQDKLEPFVDQAFLIGAVGYAGIWVGRWVCTAIMPLKRGSGIYQIPLLSALTRLIETNVKNRSAFLTLYGCCLLAALCLLSIQISEGFFFNGRDLFLSSSTLRPLFNVVISLFQALIYMIALRYAQIDKRKHLLLFIPILFISLCWGIRSLILGGILQLWMQTLFYKEGKTPLLKSGIFLLILFLSAVCIGQIRNSSFSLVDTLSSSFFAYFYGNNFSDTRDFACILSNWDGEYLWGKSYLAGFLSFIPRAFLSIREEWGIALLSNAWIGFDSTLMPGLRPGLFGETFLNFGWWGLLPLGMLFGFCLRYADLMIKHHVQTSKDLIKGYSHSVAFFFASSLMLTVGLWLFYAFILIHLFLVPFRTLFTGFRNYRHELK